MTFQRLKNIDPEEETEELFELIKKEKNPKVLRILYYLLDLFHGLDVVSASEKHHITKDTGYKYVRIWREKGINGLIPKYDNGRPSKLSQNEISDLKSEIREGKLNSGLEIQEYILKNFQIKVSISWVSQFNKELSKEDNIKYPLKKEIEEKSEGETENKVINNYINNDKVTKVSFVSPKLCFLHYGDIDQISDLIYKEKNNKLLKRYIFINALNRGLKLEDIIKTINISISTAHKWLNQWNKNGLEGLKISWSKGRPEYLNIEQKEEIKKFISKNDISNHQQLSNLIFEKFKVRFSPNYIYEWRKKN
jgi:transposase